MKFSSIRNGASVLVMAAGLAGTAQAQNVQLRADNVDQLRANMEKSVRAAARGQKVGMVTGRVDPQQERLASGAVVQELDASTMMHMVARRNADGTVEMVCVEGSEAAGKAAKAPLPAKRVSQVAKEQSHVK